MTFQEAKEMLMTPEVKAEYDKLKKEYDEIRKQLTNPSPWHAGTPTEDGTFLVLWRDTEEPIRRYSVLHWNEYNDTWYDEETSYCNWGDEDHAEVIAWQKIEPYKEKS